MAAKAPEGFKMAYRFLGNSGLQVSALSFGCWVNTGALSDDTTTADIVQTAINYGVNFLDNAETYGDAGSAETSLGKVLKNLTGTRREDLIITTKLYWSPTSEGPNSSGLSRKRIVEGLNGSLERLQLPYVDIVYAHRPDPYTPLEETIRAFNHVIEQGKAFYWGTSEWNADELAETFRICEKLNLMGPITEQPEYSLLNRTKVEKDFLPLFKKFGLGTTTWSPLASGLLTGKYNDGIPEGTRLASEKYSWLKDALLADPTKLERVAGLAPIAKELGVTQAQMALAWTLKNKDVSTVITGASSVQQFQENMLALDIVDKLTPEILTRIDEVMKSRPEPRKTMRRGLA